MRRRHGIAIKKIVVVGIGLLVPAALCSAADVTRPAAHAPRQVTPNTVDNVAMATRPAIYPGGGNELGLRRDDSPAGPETDGRAHPDREPVIISTDMTMGLTTGNRNGIESSVPDIDDSYAFALAVAQHLDVRGVVVTMGNSMVKPSMVTAQATARALGAQVPVVQGADVWLAVDPQEDTSRVDLTNTCVNDGVRFMADELRRSGGLTILAIGPLTDVACLALNYPTEAALIKQVVALVGSKPTTRLDLLGHPAVDFNYIMDPRAEAVVLEQTSIPFTAINFELSSLAPIPLARLRVLATSPNPRARFFGQASQPLVAELAAEHVPAHPIFDAAVVWHVVRPEDHVCSRVGFRLKTGSPATAQLRADNVTDWFSPEFTDTRQVTACTGFTGSQAAADFQHAVLAAVGGTTP